MVIAVKWADISSGDMWTTAQLWTTSTIGDFFGSAIAKAAGRCIYSLLVKKARFANGVAGQEDIVDEEDVMCTSIMAVFAKGGDVLRRLAGACLCRRHIARRLREGKDGV